MKQLFLGLCAVTLLAASPARASYAFSALGTVQAVGNNASDKLRIRVNATMPTLIEFDVKDNGSADFSIDAAAFTGIVVDAGGGNDVVVIDPSASAVLSTKTLTIDGGAGKDTITTLAGTQTILAGEGDDVVNAGPGNDTVLLGSSRRTAGA